MSNKRSRIEIIQVDRVELSIKSDPWVYADLHREEIDEHFKKRQIEQPALWNGRVLLLRRYAVRDQVLRGDCFETNYADFLAWREWNFPDPTVYNFFAAAALQSSDGAYVVGEMAPHTASTGQHYFPCGTPEPSDADACGHVDLTANLRRELREETGLALDEIEFEPGWTMVHDRGYLGLIKHLRIHETADRLRDRILTYLADEHEPEFTDIRIVRRRSDLDGRIPNFFAAYLQDALYR